MALFRKDKVTLSKQLRLGVGRARNRNNTLKYAGFLFLIVSAALLGFSGYEIMKHAGSQSNPQVAGATDSKTPFITYTVAKGDTVFNLAQKYNVNWTTLATINNLAAPYTLRIGQQLLIPNQ